MPTGLRDVHPRVVMYLKDISCGDGKCMEMAQNRVRRRATASGQHSFCAREMAVRSPAAGLSIPMMDLHCLLESFRVSARPV